MTNLRCQVIGLAGQIGGGKSSIARALAESLGWELGSFGDYVREIADERGLAHTRDNLQRLGADLIRDLAATEFIERVVAKSGWDRTSGLVIEGIRHHHIAEALPGFVQPHRFALVFLDAPRELRELRVKERDQFSASELNRVERHSTEREVVTLVRELADVVVAATADVAAAVSEIRKSLSKHQ